MSHRCWSRSRSRSRGGARRKRGSSSSRGEGGGGRGGGARVQLARFCAEQCPGESAQISHLVAVDASTCLRIELNCIGLELESKLIRVRDSKYFSSYPQLHSLRNIQSNPIQIQQRMTKTRLHTFSPHLDVRAELHEHVRVGNEPWCLQQHCVPESVQRH